MLYGLETALEEITLVLFTTLAPSAVFAFILVAVYLMFAEIEPEKRRRINQVLVLPLAVSMVGLVASATHLGNPANALYIFLGVGRSPLANEVFSAVIFLMFAGLYWLYSFRVSQQVTLQKIWLALIIFSGVVFITTIAVAYNAETIISWSTPYIPINLWLNAIVGGPLLALLTLQVGHAEKLAEGRFAKALCGLSLIALIGNVISMVLQNMELSAIQNRFISAAELVPFYDLVIVAYALLAAAAVGSYLYFLLKRKLPVLTISIAANVLVLAGIFLCRFTFYMMHLTMGISI